MNDISKQQNKLIFEQGQTIDNIGTNIIEASNEIDKGKEEMEEASKIADDDSLTTKACYASIIIVAVLVFMMIIMPN